MNIISKKSARSSAVTRLSISEFVSDSFKIFFEGILTTKSPSNIVNSKTRGNIFQRLGGSRTENDRQASSALAKIAIERIRERNNASKRTATK